MYINSVVISQTEHKYSNNSEVYFFPSFLTIMDTRELFMITNQLLCCLCCLATAGTSAPAVRAAKDTIVCFV